MSPSHPMDDGLCADTGAAPPPPFTLTYHKEPPVTEETETTTITKLPTGTGYVIVMTCSTGRNKITVNNGQRDQRENSHGYTDLDDESLAKLYHVIGEHLGFE